MNRLQKAKKYVFDKLHFKTKKRHPLGWRFFYVRKAVLFPHDLTRLAHYIARETNRTEINFGATIGKSYGLKIKVQIMRHTTLRK
jgi:hypothetical protein